MRKSFLRKGVATCVAVLLCANMIAQENIFVEKTDMKNIMVGRSNFIPAEVIADKTARITLPLTEDVEVERWFGGELITTTESHYIGFQVLNENLDVEKEYKVFSIDECIGTRLIIEEQLDEEGNWVEISKETDIAELEFFLYMSEVHYSGSVAMSQTLFNDDDKYEIIVPVYGGEVVYQREGNTRTIYRNYIVTALKIVSETGETLFTLEAGENEFIAEGTSGEVVRVGNKRYLVVPIGRSIADNGNWLWDIESYRWYEICKESNSVNFVRETRYHSSMNITPTIVERDTQITITLDDESNVARELIITGVNGQLIDRRDIPTGENTIQVSAAMMRSGMYNFTLQKTGEILDNAKVIVK